MKTITHILLIAISFSSSLLAADKPNVVFIFTDDQAYETIGALGLVDVDTPNLDRLVNEGTTFSHAYNMGAWSGAVCMASRTCLNTGSFLWQAQAALNDAKKGKRKVWGQLMKDAGYETYMTGKWHVPYPAKKAFDHTTHVRAGMPKAVVAGYNRPKDEADYEAGWKPWDVSKGGFWQGGKHWSEVTADDSVAFIERASQEDKPFFMYLAFNAPHDPRQAPKEYVDMYPLDRIELPENYADLYPDMGPDAVPVIRDEKLAPFPRTEYAIKVNRQEYFAIITHMDVQIGRILDALEASGKADNTWIIFTADHGLAVGHHGLVGKQNMYEHSLRPPFIVVGPGVKAGGIIDAPIYLQDAMATALELSGQPIPEDIDYKSVLPLLDGRKEKSYDTIFGAYIGTQRAVIRDGWKLIAYPKIKKLKLFNLSKDPLEMEDLAQNPEYTSVLSRMTDLLEETMDALGDPMTSLSAADYSVADKAGEDEDH
ncbi:MULTISPECIES: sulfatase-like hydrolase/transferase [unclassified Lentimonas]|uniref:sulfatase-like hydrolase/transferase n=1 Tax=unclassified Lentimonas TaxID=2630993 RepID=UPI0013296A5B|nr:MULTISPECIES: sulfatase-like hydrolase/transferase [unclassified Lentimonas]CAA6691714.1 Choline-sulfatase (EC [Lentimonas sp. CC19]CAA6696059.1 Choline-sulfatase (EC [Lentimonas sp. CC10]CAA7070068.1 Choline-sulfatase (EC [Lentimonas sp. CC11]